MTEVREVEQALLSATHRWSKAEIEEAKALRAAGNPYADRIHPWVFDQEKVWINLMGETIPLSAMDESYLLNVIAFLNGNAQRFGRLWFKAHVDSIESMTRPGTTLSIDYERVQLALKHPNKFMARTRLMSALWLEVFKRRGRISNGSEEVDD